jgi:heme/copper-type cytochrome/quinol oxidase subunit 2
MKRSWLPLITGFVITILVLLAVFIFLIFLPKKQTVEDKTALITVIPALTSTPVVGLTIVPTPTFEITETIENNYKFNVGDFVQVTGTSGEGLRLRSEPGISFSVNFIGMDAEVFEVIDGPIESDGFVWWYLEAPYDKTRNGWSVDEYLQEVTVP